MGFRKTETLHSRVLLICLPPKMSDEQGRLVFQINRGNNLIQLTLEIGGTHLIVMNIDHPRCLVTVSE